MMLTFSRVIYVFLTFIILLSSKLRRGNQEQLVRGQLSIIHNRLQEKWLEETLQAVFKVVEFFESEYRNFNIDGIFGLQALDGKYSCLPNLKEAGVNIQA